MGADIFYRTKHLEDAQKGANTLYKIKTNTELAKVQAEVTICSQDDIIWAESKENTNPSLLAYFKENLGKGIYKVSGEYVEGELNISSEEFFEMLTTIFEELNNKVEMRYLASSCAFGGSYFTDEQIDRITQNKSLMSGSKA